MRTPMYRLVALAAAFLCPLASLRADQAAMHEFGVAARPQSYADHSLYCDHLIASGVKWVRIAPEWGSIETAKGQYNAAYLAKLDAIVDRLHAADVSVLWILCYTAPWASSRPDLVWPAITRHKPQNWADWEDYVAFITSRYADKITHWEVWNEPDHGGFWKDSVADYHELLRRAHLKIKAASPANTVLLGGLAMTAGSGSGDSFGLGTFLDQLLALDQPGTTGPSRAFDVFNYHAYGDYARHVRMHAGMRDVIEKHGLHARPVWITETGYSTQGDPAKEALKADMVDQIHLGNLLWPDVERAFWHCYHNPATGNANEDNFGLMTNNLTPIPAFYHYQALGGAETDFALQTAHPSLTPTLRTLHHHIPSGGDGSHVFADGDDRVVPATRYMYFRVADAWLFDGNGGLDEQVELDITFLDVGTGNFSVQYDSAANAYRGVTVPRTGTGQWKTVTLALDDVKFANRQNGQCDFRLYAGASLPLKVRGVAVRKRLNPAVAVLGAQPRGKLIEFADTQTGDGVAPAGNIGGAECRVITADNRYLYFRVGDAFARSGNPRLDVAITFWDAGLDRLVLQYNAPGSAHKGASIWKTDTHAWRTVVVELNDADFTNAQNYNADFRLSNGWDGTEEHIRKVEVTLHPAP